MLPSVFRSFVERSPIGVMAQATVVNLFQPDRLDAVVPANRPKAVPTDSLVLGGRRVDAQRGPGRRADRLRRLPQAATHAAGLGSGRLRQARRHGTRGLGRAGAGCRPAGRGRHRPPEGPPRMPGCRATGSAFSTAITWRPPSTAWRNCGPPGRPRCPVVRWWSWTPRRGWRPTYS